VRGSATTQEEENAFPPASRDVPACRWSFLSTLWYALPRFQARRVAGLVGRQKQCGAASDGRHSGRKKKKEKGQGGGGSVQQLTRFFFLCLLRCLAESRRWGIPSFKSLGRVPHHQRACALELGITPGSCIKGDQSTPRPRISCASNTKTRREATKVKIK
jgi:hypothetical protein